MRLFIVFLFLTISYSHAESQAYLIKENLVLDLKIHKDNVGKEKSKAVVTKNGEWRVEGNSLFGKEVLADNHDASFRVFVPLKGSFVTEIEFSFIDCDEFSIAMLGGGQGQVAHLSETHMWHRIKSGQAKGTPKIYGYRKVNLNLMKTQKIRLEVHDGKMLYTVNDQEQIFSIDETLKMEQSSYAICIGGGEAEIKSLKMWKAKVSPSFKADLLSEPRKYSLGEHNFFKGDINEDSNIEIKEFKRLPNLQKHDDKTLVTLFQKKDQNQDQLISYAEWMKGVK